MADTEHFVDARPLGRPGDGRHHCRLYSAESVQLGPAWSVHPIDSAALTELHLVRGASLEGRTSYYVGEIVCMAVVAAELDCRVCITAIWPSF